MFPRCGVPDAYEGWDGFERYVRFLYDTGSIDEHTQLWWSVRPHLGFPTVEIRIADAQPDIGEARSLAAFAHALAVRIAHALDEGEPLPDYPHRLIEENLWRAIRYGLSGELIDLATGDVRPARAHSSGCSNGSRRRPRRSGLRRTSRSRPRTRPSARSPGMPRARRSRRSTPSRSARRRRLAEDEQQQKLVAELQAELAKLKVSDLLLQTLYTVSSLGYQRLTGEEKDLEQARLAIESLKALMPVLEGSVPDEAMRDFQQVLANMQLAYASAVSDQS